MRLVFGGILAAGLFAALGTAASAQMMVPANLNYTGAQMNSGYYYPQGTMPANGMYLGRMRGMRSYSSGYQGMMTTPTTTVMTTPGTTVVSAPRTMMMTPGTYQTRYYTQTRMMGGRRMGRGMKMKLWKRRNRQGYAY